MASITIYSGPMFAGKSESLIGLLNTRGKYTSKFLIKHSVDTRACNGMMLSTHGNKKITCFNIGQVTTSDDEECMMKVLEDVKDVLSCNGKVLVCVDEGQFYGDELPKFLTILRDDKAYEHVTCVVAMLDYTFERKPFPMYLRCKEIVSKEVKMTSDCKHPKCRNPIKTATFSKLLKQKDFAGKGDGNTVIIGGSDLYQSSCEECFDKEW